MLIQFAYMHRVSPALSFTLTVKKEIAIVTAETVDCIPVYVNGLVGNPVNHVNLSCYAVNTHSYSERHVYLLLCSFNRFRVHRLNIRNEHIIVKYSYLKFECQILT